MRSSFLLLSAAVLLLPVDAAIRGVVNNATDPNDSLSSSSRRKLLGFTIDNKTKARYLAVPKGYRQHPSLYSETYLRRSRENTDWDYLAEKWGKWTLAPDDATANNRPKNFFYQGFPNRDVPYDDFPATAWQKDKKYLAKFLPEAVALVERAMEAILSEYGMDKKLDEAGNLAPRNQRDELFRREMDDSSFEGLKRRILHSIMTEDTFVIAMAGHSAAAGHGNHFQQTYTIVCQRILEPIFARLGVKMTARNFGMGGLGTLQNSVASADIYGPDCDILMWDSGMTEKKSSELGVLAAQALVGMDRVPFLWYQRSPGVLESLKKIAGIDFAIYKELKYDWPKAESAEDVPNLPYAAKFFCCTKQLSEQCGTRYEGVCWQNRRDFVWEGMNLSFVPGKQNKAPGGRASWHPGNFEHQLRARTFTYPILQALLEVLQTWNSPPYKLADNSWHVTKYYNNITSAIMKNQGEVTKHCRGKHIPIAFCLYRAKGRTENTPRYRPWETSLRSIIHGSGHPGLNPPPNVYDPPDVEIPPLYPPEGQVDVLAIVENGVPYGKNMARILHSAENMQGPRFVEGEGGTGSVHNLKIEGGKGFVLKPDMKGHDNCNGEHDSWCHRGITQCLMYGHNDGRAGIIFDGFSGWQIYKLSKVEHGVIMIKFHSWCFYPPKRTEKWCSENNKVSCNGRELSIGVNAEIDEGDYYENEHDYNFNGDDEEEQNEETDRLLRRRELKPKVPPYCPGFRFEFAIDGKITSWTKEEVVEKQNHAERVVEFWTLMNDETWDQTKDVELAIRMTGCGRKKPYELTHIYWV